MDRQVVSLVLGRLGLALITILIVSFVVFAATEMLPGDVAQILLGQAATEEAVAGLRTAMHLDDPAIAPPLMVRFELAILSELGFGLDLHRPSGDVPHGNPPPDGPVQPTVRPRGPPAP